MIGAPPVAGFVSKWYLLVGALDAGSLLIIGVLITSTLLNTAYFAPVVYQAFFGNIRQPTRSITSREAHPAMVIPAEHYGGHLGRDRLLPRFLHDALPKPCFYEAGSAD